MYLPVVRSVQYSVFSNGYPRLVSPSGPRKLFKGVTTATSGVLARFPWLLPVRNPVAGYGASAVTRTPDRGHVAEVKNQFHGVAGSQSGFPKKPFSPLMSTCAVTESYSQRPRRASLRGFPFSSLSGTLLWVTGPPPSLVPRTEDMWQK